MVLLFLVVVAQLALTLCCHATLRLRHLVGIVGTRTVVALVLVVALDVGRRVGARSVVLAHGVVALRSAHARVCR